MNVFNYQHAWHLSTAAADGDTDAVDHFFRTGKSDAELSQTLDALIYATATAMTIICTRIPSDDLAALKQVAELAHIEVKTQSEVSAARLEEVLGAVLVREVPVLFLTARPRDVLRDVAVLAESLIRVAAGLTETMVAQVRYYVETH